MHEQQPNNTIFIHSLWRSGSTYLFSLFRNSVGGYWCYQEPIHETALKCKDDPDKLLLYVSDTQQINRHPDIGAPYYQELYETWEHWRSIITKSIIYDGYFDTVGDENLMAYISALIIHSKGKPVIQECRTSNRIGIIKKGFGGVHIYLWRNPFDQWLSYKCTNYFDITSQLILNAPSHPNIIDRLREHIEFKEFNHIDINKEFNHFDQNRLTAENSYLLFYSLWCLGLLEAIDNADILLNIDTLSDSKIYQENILDKFLSYGITDIDFSGCNMPQTYYSSAERLFFNNLEERVHAMLSMCGHSQSQISQLQEFRSNNEPKLWALSVNEISAKRLLADSTRAREIVLRYETENAQRLSDISRIVDEEYNRIEWLENEWNSSKSKVEELSTEVGKGHDEIVRLSKRLAIHEGELAEKIQTQLELAELVYSIVHQLQDENHGSSPLEQKYADRLKELTEQSDQSQQELESKRNFFDQRERELAEQIIAIQRQAAREKSEQLTAQAERERELRQQHSELEHSLAKQLKDALEELHRLLHGWAVREEELVSQTQQVRQELETLLHTQVQREREFASQMLTLSTELGAMHAEQERQMLLCHAEREQTFTRQQQDSNEEHLRLKREWAVLEKSLVEQNRQEMEAYLHTLARREQEFAVQLMDARNQAEQEKARLGADHIIQLDILRLQNTEREQFLVGQQQDGEAEHCRLQQEWELRAEELNTQINQALLELESLQQTLERREQEFAVLLKSVQQRAELEKAEFEDALYCKLAEQKQVFVDLEAELKAKILLDRQARLRYQQMLSDVQKTLATMQGSLAWRMSLPLRKIATLFAPSKRSTRLPPLAKQANPSEMVLPAFSEPQLTYIEQTPISPLMTPSLETVHTSNVTVANTLDELLSYHDRHFVCCAYRTLLGREPDPDGLNYYLNRLRAGYSKIRILQQLRHSSESFLCGAYQTLLGRPPDPEGRYYYLGQLSQGDSKRSILRQLRRSPEGVAYRHDRKNKGLKTALPGLEKAIRHFQRGQFPFIGWLFRLIYGTESDRPADRKLRAIENLLYIQNNESNNSFHQIDAALSGLHSLIIQQTEIILTAIKGFASTQPYEAADINKRPLDRKNDGQVDTPAQSAKPELQSILSQPIIFKKASPANVIEQIANLLNKSKEASNFLSTADK